MQSRWQAVQRRERCVPCGKHFEDNDLFAGDILPIDRIALQEFETALKRECFLTDRHFG
jgi:hypothetical protein